MVFIRLLLGGGFGPHRDGTAAAADQPGAGQKPDHGGEVQQTQGSLSEAA